MLWFSLLGCVRRKCKYCLLVFPQNLTSFLHEKDTNESLIDVLGVHQHKMAFIWREREHEEQDLNVGNDPATIQALKNCGLLKLF